MKTVLLNTIKIKPFWDPNDVNLFLRMKGIKKEDIIVFKHVDENLYVFKHGNKICDQMGYVISHLDSDLQKIFNDTFTEIN
jgi:hypothetical protein